jgi:hypothetical protein
LNNFLFSNFENFLIAAIALHIGFMWKGTGIMFAQIEDEPPPKGYEFEYFIYIRMFLIHFKLLACSLHRLCHEWLAYIMVLCDSNKRESEGDGNMFHGQKPQGCVKYHQSYETKPVNHEILCEHKCHYKIGSSHQEKKY